MHIQKVTKLDFPKNTNVFKDKSKFITDYLESLEEIPQEFPIVITNDDGEHIIESDMVEIKNTKIIQRGEWFTPHVIEPAFGIDRIIWHILEHSHKEISKKDDENYTVLSLNSDVVPIDFSVYPLFEKDGMGLASKKIVEKIRSIKGINVNYDGSKSIGRRYARGDEVGVPFAITVDHQSLEDNTITLRERDSQNQKRMSIEDLLEFVSEYK